MAAAYRSMSVAAMATRTNTTLSVPAGTVNGDVLITLHQGFSPSGTAIPVTTPTGWNLFSGFPATSVYNGYGCGTYAFWRIASSEPASYTFNHASNDTDAYMFAVSGAGTGTPKISGAPIIGASMTSTAQSITTTVDGALIAFFSANWSPGYGAASPPTGFTERYDPAGSYTYLATMVQATAGATGNVTHNNQNSTSDFFAALLIGIEPTAGGGGTVASGAGTAAGAATATATSVAAKTAAGTSAGAATATAVGRGAALAAGTAAGAATATAVGSSSTLSSAQGTATASSTATAVGRSAALAVGTAAGAATAAATGTSATLTSASGSAAGIATATATGRSSALAIGMGFGMASGLATGRSAALAAGTSTGAATAQATGQGTMGGSSTGTATGTSTAIAVGSAAIAAVGTSDGASTAAATGQGITGSVGTSSPYPELIENGTFDTDTSSWVATTGGALSWSAGVLRTTSTLSNNYGSAVQGFPTVIGNPYEITGRLVASSHQGWIIKSDSNAVFSANRFDAAGGTLNTAMPRNVNKAGFIATASTTYIWLLASNIVGAWTEYDNIIVRESPALGVAVSTKAATGTATADSTATATATVQAVSTGTANGRATAVAIAYQDPSLFDGSGGGWLVKKRRELTR